MNKNFFRVKDGVLYYLDKSIDLPYLVVDLVDCSGVILARVEPPAGVIFNRNIYAFSEMGDFCWQIEESPHGTQADKPYINVVCNTQGKIVAQNWNGVDYLVDASDGSILASAFDK